MRVVWYTKHPGVYVGAASGAMLIVVATQHSTRQSKISDWIIMAFMSFGITDRSIISVITELPSSKATF